MSNLKTHLICIVGPTASGKTNVAIQLAKLLNTVVVSADARQVYAEMQIGTARPTIEELQGVPHYLLGHISIGQSYNVGDYEREALALLETLFQDHQTIILVGGSGLYVKTLLFGIDELPEVEPKLRQLIQQELKERGLAPLVQELLVLDPVFCLDANLTNPARVTRALEICKQTSKPYSSYLTNIKANRAFDHTIWGIDLPRHLLYERIDLRVNLMMEAGLEDEVERLSEFQQLKAMQTIGYKEWESYNAGLITKTELVAQIQQNTRRYAKRQMTWFRNQLEVQWFDQTELLIEAVETYYKTFIV